MHFDVVTLRMTSSFLSMKKSEDKGFVKSEWASLLQGRDNSMIISDPKELQSKVTYLEDTLSHIMNSKSWKLTLPLRKIRKMI
jgi:hypothetical protein